VIRAAPPDRAIAQFCGIRIRERLPRLILPGPAERRPGAVRGGREHTDLGVRTVRFDLAGGNDVVPNRTAVPIRADGGDGNDDLRANAGSDRLLGGAGSDLLRGGLGADDLDGGLGWDSVTYPENGHEGVRLVVTIDNMADDGARNLGEIANEGDNVRTSNEIVEGNSGNDTFIGNELPNTLRVSWATTI
jgi:hypothetical protein